MTGNNTHLSILTLKINGLNVPVKRYRLANEVRKQDPTICCLEDSSHWKNKQTNKQTTGLESKGGKRFSKQTDPINRQK
jgi:hypothetical protein